MNTGKILTQAQAEAVYRAMAELNNVGMRLDAELVSPRVMTFDRVFEDWAGAGVGVRRVVDGDVTQREDYPSQDAFAQAYGLTTGAGHHE